MKTTQTWKIGNCLQLLPEIPDKSIDLILTDPPYNIDSQGKVNFEMVDGVFNFKEVNYNYPSFDLNMVIPSFYNKLKDSGSIVVFYDNKEMTTLWNVLKKNNLKPKQILYWYKGRKGINPRRNFNSTVETAIWAVKSKEYTWNGNGNTPNCFVEDYHELNYPPNNYHSNQKPIRLFEWIIKILTNKYDTVFDGYLGSGTSLVACMRLNRNCVGFEIYPQCEPIYKKRLSKKVTEQKRFINTTVL